MKIYVCLLLLICRSTFGQSDNLYKFANEDGKYGFIDCTGKIIIPPKYLFVQDFSEGLAFVADKVNSTGYLWTCINKFGDLVFETPDFVSEEYKNGFAILHGSKGYYFVDRKGRQVFDQYFQDIRGNFSEGYALISHQKYKNFIFIDTTGNYVKKLPYLNGTVFRNGVSTFFTKGKGDSIFDLDGRVLIDGVEEVSDFSNYPFLIKKNGKWGFIDRNGKVLIDFIYEKDRRREFDEILKLNTDSLDALPKSRLRNVGHFRDGLAKFQSDSLWGYINTKNEVVIPAKFKKANDFSEGKAGISLDGKTWGFIDANGKFVIEPKFYLVDSFENNLCAVRTNYQMFEVANDYYLDAIIDMDSNIVIREEMHCYMGFQGDLIEYYGGGHFTGGVHYINKKGEKVIPKK